MFEFEFEFGEKSLTKLLELDSLHLQPQLRRKLRPEPGFDGVARPPGRTLLIGHVPRPERPALGIRGDRGQAQGGGSLTGSQVRILLRGPACERTCGNCAVVASRRVGGAGFALAAGDLVEVVDGEVVAEDLSQS